MSGQTRPEPLRRRSMAEQAMDAIREMIISGELKPGEALPAERQLAEMFDISRPTLREAITALTAMSILEARQGEGTFVTALSPIVLTGSLKFLIDLDDSSLKDLFEVRGILEVNAARLAAPRASSEVVEALSVIVERAAHAIDAPDEFAELDLQLHSEIINAAGNRLLAALCASIADLTRQSRRLTAGSERTRAAGNRDHRKILAAMADRDGEAAATVMRSHLESMAKAAAAAAATARQPRRSRTPGDQ